MKRNKKGKLTIIIKVVQTGWECHKNNKTVSIPILIQLLQGVKICTAIAKVVSFICVNQDFLLCRTVKKNVAFHEAM